MSQYLLDQASGNKLGYFNRHYFVAATFNGQDDNGKHLNGVEWGGVGWE
jgi:hypothetical protein